MAFPKSTSDTVIRLLEKERKSLKRMIKEAQAEGDILIVYHHSQAMQQIEQQLDVLYHLRDPLYNQKRHLNLYINYLKSDKAFNAKSSLKSLIKELTLEKIEQSKTELLRLNNIAPVASHASSNHIEVALFKLWKRQCNGFTILLNKKTDFALKFKKKKSLLEISINRKFEAEERDINYGNKFPMPLEGIGFKYNPARRKYTINHMLIQTEDIAKIRMWLAHFFFDFCRLSYTNGALTLIYQ